MTLAISIKFIAPRGPKANKHVSIHLVFGCICFKQGSDSAGCKSPRNKPSTRQIQWRSLMKVGSASFAPSQSQQNYIILRRNVKKQPPPPPPSPAQQQKTHEDREEERQHGNRNTFHLTKGGLCRFPSCLLVAPKAGCSMENHGMTFRPWNWRATTTNAIYYILEPTF